MNSTLVNDIQFELNISNFDSIKSFSFILHLLNKVGKDLLLEIENNTLYLRSLNDAKSAFALVKFDKDFFDYIQSVDGKNFCCKVQLKVLCSMMKNIRNVKSLKVRAQIIDSEHELVFEMSMASSLKRTYRFLYSDCDIISVAFDDESASQIKADPKVFIKLLEHIHLSQEISIIADENTFKIKSFHADDDFLNGLSQARDNNLVHDNSMRRVISTGVNIDTSEFDVYNFKPINIDEEDEEEDGNQRNYQELIFCIKEFRAMLAFCETQDLSDFQLLFTKTGRPMKLSCLQRHFEVDILMSTLTPNASSKASAVEREPEFQMPTVHSNTSRSKGKSKPKPKSTTSISKARRNKRNNNEFTSGMDLDEEEEDEEEEEAIPDQRRQGMPGGVSSSSKTSLSLSRANGDVNAEDEEHGFGSTSSYFPPSEPHQHPRTVTTTMTTASSSSSNSNSKRIVPSDTTLLQHVPAADININVNRQRSKAFHETSATVQQQRSSSSSTTPSRININSSSSINSSRIKARPALDDEEEQAGDGDGEDLGDASYVFDFSSHVTTTPSSHNNSKVKNNTTSRKKRQIVIHSSEEEEGNEEPRTQFSFEDERMAAIALSSLNAYPQPF